MKVLVAGGRVYDPSNGVHGEEADIAIDGGKIVARGGDFRPDRRIDASGCAVLPGGVDMHCHIAGPPVNRARRLLAGGAPPVAARFADRDGSAADRLVPSTFLTGCRYAALGYTTAIEAAVSPSGSRQCHLELEDTPNIDRGFLLLLGNHELILDLVLRGEREAAREAAASLLERSGAFGIKAVNPGGVSLWKSDSLRVSSFSAKLGARGLSPRSVLETLVETAEELRLPHPVHIHANGLGLPGNIETTLETSRALEGRRHHLTHVQFHAYGDDGKGGHTSAAARLAEHFNRHPELTMDVGQVMFGEALTLSADLALEHVLWQLTGRRHASIEVELETGCGMVPFKYSAGSRLHALQWAVGLEISLLAEDPWRLALSTDHPNGASFLSYPAIIALLMSRDLRREALRAANAEGIGRSALADIDREYSLGEIAIITRAAPARILGLPHKGHLGPGADADVTILDEWSDRERMFRTPRYVLKSGVVVVEKGELRGPGPAETFRAAIARGRKVRGVLERWFERHGSYRLAQMGPGAERLSTLRAIGREEAREAP
ncbi:MAG TPA: formylmethanofuran dehydrogenase subunit A [Planctomycetota bacterium]|nr:formylmethanofuran dehydrogenase subunit A [Planctomycetota bacterium]